MKNPALFLRKTRLEAGSTLYSASIVSGVVLELRDLSVAQDLKMEVFKDGMSTLWTVSLPNLPGLTVEDSE